jgi:hypothetical protein
LLADPFSIDDHDNAKFGMQRRICMEEYACIYTVIHASTLSSASEQKEANYQESYKLHARTRHHASNPIVQKAGTTCQRAQKLARCAHACRWSSEKMAHRTDRNVKATYRARGTTEGKAVQAIAEPSSEPYRAD